jgi:hypothetical protein
MVICASDQLTDDEKRPAAQATGRTRDKEIIRQQRFDDGDSASPRTVADGNMTCERTGNYFSDLLSKRKCSSMRPAFPARRCCLRKALLAAAVVVFLATSLCAKDVALITQKANTVKSVPLADLVKICKGTTKTWADGKPVKLIVVDPTLPAMRVVIEKVFGATAAEVKATLQKTPGVQIVPSEQVALTMVATTPGSLSFVDVYSINGNVSVIKIDDKLPLEPGYLLHRSQ